MRARLGFGLGTFGRDMVAALVAMYLMFYLTDVLQISGAQLGAITVILVVMRIFDAVNDPFMGVVVDNTRTRWGKFKPWIFWGALLWGAATLMLFFDFGVHGWGYVIVFTVVYLVYEIAYTINDIAFWSMLPSLTQDQREREKIGVTARICANVGLFAVVVGLVPITNALTAALGSAQQAWFVLAAVLVVIMLAFQSLTLIFTRERIATTHEATRLRELFGVIFRNDQLLWVTLAMVAYMTGYSTTTSFGLYYFKYVFGDEGASSPPCLASPRSLPLPSSRSCRLGSPGPESSSSQRSCASPATRSSWCRGRACCWWGSRACSCSPARAPSS